MKKTFSMILFLAMVLVVFIGAMLHAEANQCSTSNVRAWDMGGGTLWDKNYVIDVYGVTKNDGFFIYYDPGAESWKSIKWDSVYLIDNNTGIRFGVSTGWAYVHPWWKDVPWRYVYPN